MLQRILGGLTIALLAASFSGNNSSASPLEDSLAVPAEHDACTKEFVPLREEAVARGKLIKAARAAFARRTPSTDIMRPQMNSADAKPGG